MNPSMTLAVALLVFAILGPGSLLSGAEKDKQSPDKARPEGTVHTVTASMGYPTDGGVGIQAEKQPAEFSIPKGSVGTKLKYKFRDPKSDTTLTKLTSSNVYSVTEHRYMRELDKDPTFELPPGDYKFVVGGEPGAMGTLTYTTAPAKDTTPKDKVTLTKEVSKGDNAKLPGNVDKKKVVIKFKTGEIPAYLTVQGNKFTLDVDFGPLPKYTTSATQRWEGSLESSRGVVSAKGTIDINATVTNDRGRHGFTKCRGAFSGNLDGQVLRGSVTIDGQDKAPDEEPKPYHDEDTYSIQGFGP